MQTDIIDRSSKRSRGCDAGDAEGVRWVARKTRQPNKNPRILHRTVLLFGEPRRSGYGSIYVGVYWSITIRLPWRCRRHARPNESLCRVNQRSRRYNESVLAPSRRPSPAASSQFSVCRSQHKRSTGHAWTRPVPMAHACPKLLYPARRKSEHLAQSLTG